MKKLWMLLSNNKKLFLIPIIVFVILFVVLLIFTGGISVAPFEYAIF